MTHEWQLQEAKNRFSEMVQEAMRNGPQVVTRHGDPAVVVLSIQDYQKLMKPDISLTAFFQKSPLRETNLDLERNKDLGRHETL